MPKDDDHTPHLTAEDLALWDEITEKVAQTPSSKKPKQTKQAIDTMVEDLADNFTYRPHDLDDFEAYIDGPPPEQRDQPQKTVETVVIESLMDAPVHTPAPKPANPFDVIEHTAELIIGARGGVDNRTLKKLSQGEYRPTRRLDLHGHYLLDAYQAIRIFIDESQAQGHKCVLVIHGKGRGVHQEMGVIKQNISQFLSDIPSVLAFHTAQPRDGGGGACYVLLRSKRKQK